MNEGGAAGDPRARRYREASQWLLRLQGDAPAEAEVSAWLQWCERDPQNLAAFESIQADWRGILALRQDAAFMLNHGRETGSGRGLRAGVGSRVFKYGAAAAVLLALLGALRGTLADWHESWRGEAIVAGTANRTTSLADGSTLILRARAGVRVRYTATARRLSLQDGGEAYFDVRHDPARPFVVHVGELAVQAIGTAFDIRHEADTGRTWVMVEAGRVKVSGPGDGEWIAAAGERLEWSAARGAAVEHVSAGVAAGWRRGEFAYEKVPLHRVIAEIGGYFDRPITIADERARQIPYTGTVFARSLDDWLVALSLKYPVRVVSGHDGSIVLESD